MGRGSSVNLETNQHPCKVLNSPVTTPGGQTETIDATCWSYTGTHGFTYVAFKFADVAGLISNSWYDPTVSATYSTPRGNGFYKLVRTTGNCQYAGTWHTTPEPSDDVWQKSHKIEG